MAKTPAPVNPACQSCGATPAAKVVFQSIEGLVLMHTIRTVRGYFCRDCGLRVQKEMNTRTLQRGWFSLGAIIGMPIFLTVNSVRSGKLKKLPAPVRA
jgi:hypothetical protein